MQHNTAQCEKLVAIRSDGVDWWTDLPTASTGFFAHGGRLVAVEEEYAFEEIVSIRRDGFSAVVICPDWQTERRLLMRSRGARERAGFLLRGRDDDQIMYLLSHPSRQVLEGLAKKRRLVCPSEDYRAALEAWIHNDKLAQQVINRLQGNEIRLTEFNLLDNTSGTDQDGHSDPLKVRFSFAWRLNLHRRVELMLDLEHGAYLFQTVDGVPDDAPIRFGESILIFEQGDCILTQEHTQTIIEHFQLPNDYFWNDPDRAAFLDTVAKKLRVLFQQTGTRMGERINTILFTPKQTLLLPMAMQQLTAAAGGLRVYDEQASEPIAVMLNPILVVRPDHGKYLSMDVHWIGGAPKNVPETIVYEDTQIRPSQAKWSENFAQLAITRFYLKRSHRLSWEWKRETNRLIIHILNNSLEA